MSKPSDVVKNTLFGALVPFSIAYQSARNDLKLREMGRYIDWNDGERSTPLPSKGEKIKDYISASSQFAATSVIDLLTYAGSVGVGALVASGLSSHVESIDSTEKIALAVAGGIFISSLGIRIKASTSIDDSIAESEKTIRKYNSKYLQK